MPLVPKQKTPFNLSGITAKRNPPQFRAYGSDESEKSQNFIYFGSALLGRTVAFKAFIGSLKINLDKQVDTLEYADRNYRIFKEKSATLSYNLQLNIPAHSVNEAGNNLAKIEELQRLIMQSKVENRPFEPLAGANPIPGINKPIFLVYFKNLINSGRFFPQSRSKSDPSHGVVTEFSQLIYDGFPCYIENINYEPDMDFGFFDYDHDNKESFSGQLYPKLITLNVTLNYDSNTLLTYTNNLPLMPFQTNGHFSDFDTSLFPFGVRVASSNTSEKPSSLGPRLLEYTIEDMNGIFPFGGRGQALSSYVFIGLPIDPAKQIEATQVDNYNNPEQKVARWVVFKPFIEAFNRDHQMNIIKDEEVDSPIFGMASTNGVSFKGLDYSFKINLPAENLEEAKKNCGKIQYLFRMFLRREKVDFQNEEFCASDLNRKVMVYIPKMIERPNAPSGLPQDAELMFQNALPFFLESIDLEIDTEGGFLEDIDIHRIYPKFMSITLSIKATDDSYIRPYQLNNNEGGDESYSIPGKKGSTGSDYVGLNEAHLFPFNKQTSKIKIGGN